MEGSLPAETHPIDHVEELIDSLARQLAHDSGGEDYVTFERGDGRRLVRVPTFHSELLLPHLDELRQYRTVEGGGEEPPALKERAEEVRRERERRIREYLEGESAALERYVEGD